MTALFLSVLNQSLMASLFIGAVLPVRLLFSRVRRSVFCVLWLPVALCLLIPVTLESDFSLMPLAAPTNGLLSAVSAETPVPEEPMTDIGFLSSVPSSDTDTFVWPEDTVFHVYTLTSPTAPVDADTQKPDFMPALSAVWVLSMTACVLYAGISYARLKQHTAVSVIADGIRICDGIDTPFILGLFRPEICLPSHGITRGAREAILLHERAHIARRDHLTKPLAFLVCCVYWFNPLVWVAYGAFCRDLELACDERATASMGIEEKRAYADALLLCSIRGNAAKALLSGTLAFGEVGVRTRIRRVLGGKRAGILLTLLCIAVISLLAVCLLTTPRVLPSDIYQQNGFRVTAIAEDLDMEFTVPLDVLDERAYTQEGQHFADGEVVIHKAGATTVSLVHVYHRENKNLLTKDSAPTLNFTFRFTYDDLKKHNVITLLYKPNYEGEKQTYITTALGMVSDTLIIGGTHYDNAIRSGGNGHGTETTVSIDANIHLSKDLDMRFSMTGFCELSYEIGKPNAANDMAHLTGGSVYGQAGTVLGRLYTAETVQAYVTDRCLYMTPLSSFLPLGGNDGNLYALVRNERGELTTDFGHYDRAVGRNRISFDVGEDWMPFPYTADEWMALFSLSEAPDLSDYERIRCMKLHRNDLLLSLDDELWYCKTYGLPDGTRQMWSIYSLIPERDKGEAFWCDAPMLNHTRSHFHFLFDIPGLTKLTLTTETGTIHKGGTSTQRLVLTDGFEIDFDPVGMCTEITVCAETDKNTAPLWGTVYIEEYQKNSDGRTYYRATVVGTGLTVTSDGADGAILTVQ